MRFTKPVLAAYVYACLDGNRVASSPLSTAISKIIIDESPTFRRRMTNLEVTCTFKLDNYVTHVWVDGKNKLEDVIGDRFSSRVVKTLQFDDSAELLAIDG